jgi:hypothetical protein
MKHVTVMCVLSHTNIKKQDLFAVGPAIRNYRKLPY